MNEQVTKAENELQEFLEKNPKMQKDQEKLRDLLDKTPHEKRIEVLSMLLSAKLLEMKKQLLNLTELYYKQ